MVVRVSALAGQNTLKWKSLHFSLDSWIAMLQPSTWWCGWDWKQTPFKRRFRCDAMSVLQCWGKKGRILLPLPKPVDVTTNPIGIKQTRVRFFKSKLLYLKTLVYMSEWPVGYYVHDKYILTMKTNKLEAWSMRQTIWLVPKAKFENRFFKGCSKHSSQMTWTIALRRHFFLLHSTFSWD